MKRLLLIVAVFGLAACGEETQVVNYEQGKYKGKTDGLPWDSEPLAAEWRGGKWTKGNRESWEESIKARQLAQHEHRRIYQ